MKLSDSERETLAELEGVKRLSQYGVGQALALQHILERGRDHRDQQAEADLERVQRVLSRRGVTS